MEVTFKRNFQEHKLDSNVDKMYKGIRNLIDLDMINMKIQIFTNVHSFIDGKNFHSKLHFTKSKARLQENDFMCHNKFIGTEI